jgi:hypothetical protein
VMYFTPCSREIHQFLVCADDVNILGGSVATTQKNKKSLVVVLKKLDWKQMVTKLSTWSCLEIRMQNKVTI